MRSISRFLLISLFLCFFAFASVAQTTSVSGTVTDPNGLPYAGGTLKAQLVLAGAGVTGQPTVTVNNAQQCKSANAGSAPCQVTFQGTAGPITLDSTGSFTGLTLQDNTLVTPASTQWLFIVGITPGIPPPAGFGPQTFSVAITITGASQSVTSNLSNAALPLARPGANSDPPVTQSFSISATGAQTAINLSAAGIDTHILEWRPVGTVTTCTVALDTSPDGVTWTPGGAIAGQACTSAGQTNSQPIIANFVRVNVTTLTGGGSLTVVYSGRLAPSYPLGNGISNGTFVTTSDILWNQLTEGFNGGSAGTACCGVTSHSITTTFRILKTDGSIYDAAQQGTSWIISGPGGNNGVCGTGLNFPVAGWLQSVTTYVSAASGGTVQPGQTFSNLYILRTMPAGGSTSACATTFTFANGPHLLTGAPLSTFYPVSWQTGAVAGTAVAQLPGALSHYGITNPGAGANLTITLPTTDRVNITGIHTELVTSNQAGNRVVCLVQNNSSVAIFSGIWLQSCAMGIQPASQTLMYDFLVGTGSSGGSNGRSITVPLPFGFTSPAGIGTQFTIFISGIQTNDQIQNTVLTGQTYQENN